MYVCVRLCICLPLRVCVSVFGSAPVSIEPLIKPYLSRITSAAPRHCKVHPSCTSPAPGHSEENIETSTFSPA